VRRLLLLIPQGGLAALGVKRACPGSRVLLAAAVSQLMVRQAARAAEKGCGLGVCCSAAWGEVCVLRPHESVC
jgi:hypothetical protein